MMVNFRQTRMQVYDMIYHDHMKLQGVAMTFRLLQHGNQRKVEK